MRWNVFIGLGLDLTQFTLTAEAQFELGRCHDEGRGMEQDVSAAGM